MMPVKIYTLNVMFILAALFATVSMNAADTGSPRQELAADAGWKFCLGDPGGAEATAFVDSSWRTVNLPHDWSIESAPEKRESGRRRRRVLSSRNRMVSQDLSCSRSLER